MDSSRLKSKLAELKSQNGDRRVMWKPKPGTQTIRIVPYIHNKDWPFVELYFHYKVTKKPILSPTSFDKPDPIKEFAEMLQSTGDRDEWKQGKTLEPKRRTYAAILVRGEEDQGVKIWGFGTQIYEQLLSKIDNPKWGDITDPLEGRDIEVTFVKATGPNAFPTTTIDVDPERTPVTQNKDVLDKMKDMPDIKTLWDEMSYDDLKVILNTYVGAGATAQTIPSNDVDRSTSDNDSGVTEAVATGTIPLSDNHKTDNTDNTANTVKAGSNSVDVKAAFDSYFKK